MRAWRDQERSSYVLLLCPILTLLIGLGDYYTGPYVSFAFIYLIPVVLAAWFGGFVPAIFVSLMAITSMTICELLSFGHPGTMIWNAVVRSIFFLLISDMIRHRKKFERTIDFEKYRMQQFIEALPVGIFALDSNKEVFLINKVASDILQKEDLHGKVLVEDLSQYYQAYKIGTDELYPPEKLPIVRALNGENVVVRDLEIRRSDRSVPLSIYGAPIRDKDGTLLYAVVAFSDVSAVRNAEKELIKTNDQLQESVKKLERRNEQILLLSLMQELLHSSMKTEECLQIVERFANQLLPDFCGVIYLVKDSPDKLELDWQWGIKTEGWSKILGSTDCYALRRGQIHVCVGEMAEIRCTHLANEINRSICIPMISQGDLVGLLQMIPSVSDQDLLESKITLCRNIGETLGLTLANLRLRDSLRSLAIRDPLTNLFNRRYMEETFDREISRSRRNNRMLSVLMVDLDYFKSINDRFGHPAGDEVLVRTSQLLQGHARKDDIICRLGGEEFLIVLNDCEKYDALHKAEQIRAAIAEMDIKEINHTQVTASIGLSFFPENGNSSETLLNAADAELYRAKSAGRNCVSPAVLYTRSS